MYISYFDETGDDGYPQYSSEIFILTSIYMHHKNWKGNLDKLMMMRKNLKLNYNIPIKYEIHTKQLALNKNPYKVLNLDEEKIFEIFLFMAKCAAELDARVVNVSIDKTKINERNKKNYANVLDTALKFNVQRIENDLKKKDPNTKFFIITDEGRVAKMRTTTRKIQAVNFIPSKYNLESYREEIKLLIEDPLPKNSKESFFIQLADFISYLVFLNSQNEDKWNNRLYSLDHNKVLHLLRTLSPLLNLDAASDSVFGIVSYPK